MKNFICGVVAASALSLIVGTTMHAKTMDHVIANDLQEEKIDDVISEMCVVLDEMEDDLEAERDLASTMDPNADMYYRISQLKKVESFILENSDEDFDFVYLLDDLESELQ